MQRTSTDLDVTTLLVRNRLDRCHVELIVSDSGVARCGAASRTFKYAPGAPRSRLALISPSIQRETGLESPRVGRIHASRGLKATLAVLVALLCLGASERMSQAKLVEIWASGLLGGATGNGKTNRDFFNWAGGGAAGVEVGAQVLFLSAYIDYLRFFGGDTGANLVGFNLGGDSSIGLVGNLSLVFRLAGTFYLGSLDSADARGSGTSTARTSEVETRGLGVRGGVGLRYSFAKIFSVGTTPQIGYHYFFGGADDDLTDTDQNSSGWDFQMMAYLRAAFGI